MIQIANGINGNLINIVIIHASDSDMPFWGHIDDSNIITSNFPISTAFNKQLTMCEAEVGHVDK